MATINKRFESKELEEFDEFLTRNSVTMVVNEEPEEFKTHFRFRKKLIRLLEETQWCDLGDKHYKVPKYELVVVQCEMPIAFSLHSMSVSDLVDTLKAFVTDEFHLNEERFRLGCYEYMHA